MLLTKNVLVRRNNGQCDYGPWLPIDDPDVPLWVCDLVGDEIAEVGKDEGKINKAGSIWKWKKRDAS